MQHSFRNSRSCLTNLLAFLDMVTVVLDEGECIDAIFLDFAKAFDKVPHQRLLQKLTSHGIDSKIKAWISGWLKQRKQRVTINGVFSDWREVFSGVPQGSVLGPVLFLIYINDLDNGVRNWILKFADDTKLFGRVRNSYDGRRLQQDLDKLIKWSENWQMLFNMGKCKEGHAF